MVHDSLLACKGTGYPTRTGLPRDALLQWMPSKLLE